jgi:ribosomal protein S18 acetylase RimI-like enzyme
LFDDLNHNKRQNYSRNTWDLLRKAINFIAPNIDFLELLSSQQPLLSEESIMSATPMRLLVLLVILARSLCLQLQYRPARTSDLPGIAKLLTATFEQVPEWNFIQWKMAESGYQQQLGKRMSSLVQAGAKHTLIVVATETGEIAGFMELGTMPSPIPVKTMWEGVETDSRPEMPYLANVAVGQSYQRQRMGSKLVLLAEKLSKKWCATDLHEPALYLAVDTDNKAAVNMYDKLGFIRFLDETDKLSDKALRKMKRKPRLYYQKVLPIDESGDTLSSSEE